MRRHITVLGISALLVVMLVPTASAAPTTCNGLVPTIVADGSGAIIEGTEGDDVIFGTSGNDIIFGNGGSDTICGLAGRDTLNGGPGIDWIHGGPGADHMLGERGPDVIQGGPGNDVLVGGRGDDLLLGDDGDDVLRGGYHHDTLSGGPGEDRLFGGLDADSLDGGDSHDFLNGGRGNDTLSGGPGEDEIWGRGGADLLIGGGDLDLLRAGYGIDECIGERLGGCEIAEVAPGDSGSHVAYLQSRLADAMLYRGSNDGVYPGGDTDLPGRLMAAVMAFHKLHEDPLGQRWTPQNHVSATWTLDDWDRLDDFDPVVPKTRSSEPNRLEVDAHHEVMWLVLDGALAGIFHVSIGGEYLYLYQGEYRLAHTPRGDFDLDYYSLGQKVNGWQYKSWYFERNYFAVHGFYKVPPYPASHGCVRVLYQDADWLTNRLQVDWPIHIWDE